jgi:hypothetical protein
MVHITPTPTADLFLYVPGPLGHGSWAWSEHPRWPGVLASDYAYSGHEASALVRAYATTMARLIQPREANRFTMLARGRTTGLVLARDEWEWCPREHAYAPTDSEPWNTWKAAARVYWQITGRLIERQRFRPRLDV